MLHIRYLHGGMRKNKCKIIHAVHKSCIMRVKYNSVRRFRAQNLILHHGIQACMERHRHTSCCEMHAFHALHEFPGTEMKYLAWISFPAWIPRAEWRFMLGSYAQNGVSCMDPMRRMACHAWILCTECRFMIGFYPAWIECKKLIQVRKDTILQMHSFSIIHGKKESFLAPVSRACLVPKNNTTNSHSSLPLKGNRNCTNDKKERKKDFGAKGRGKE